MSGKRVINVPTKFTLFFTNKANITYHMSGGNAIVFYCVSPISQAGQIQKFPSRLKFNDDCDDDNNNDAEGYTEVHTV